MTSEQEKVIQESYTQSPYSVDELAGKNHLRFMVYDINQKTGLELTEVSLIDVLIKMRKKGVLGLKTVKHKHKHEPVKTTWPKLTGKGFRVSVPMTIDRNSMASIVADMIGTNNDPLSRQECFDYLRVHGPDCVSSLQASNNPDWERIYAIVDRLFPELRS